MSTTLALVDSPGDAELITAVRGGDVDSYGVLFSRHVDAARRLARQLVSGPDVDDLVSEAFAKVLVVLQRGGGPDLAFRAYLLTAVRRLHVDRIRAGSRLHSTDDLTPFDPGVPFRDTAVEGFENAAAARAFASLPERWQTVLWHTEVEGQKPADVALLLGISANSVSALAYRAREGLRQAFLSMHVQETADDACRWTREHLGSYIRKGLSRRDASRIEAHLGECRGCAAIYLELTEVNSNLSGLLAPLLLGGAAAAYVASSGGGAAAGGVLALLGRGRDLALSHAPAAVVAGVTVGALVVGGVFLPHRGPGLSPDDAGVGVRTEAGPGVDGRTTPHPPRRRPDSGHRDAPTTKPPSGAAPTPAPGRAVPASSAPATGSPGPQHSPGSSDSPAPRPGSQPGSPAGGPPEGPPNSPPSSPPSGPPTMDLAVTATAQPTAGAVFAVRVRVAGLTQGQTATLTVTSNDTAVVLTLDQHCLPRRPGSGSCAVTTTPATYDFLAAPAPGTRPTLTFTVRPDGSAVEANPSDNTTRVTLTP